jgi:hypothetical protein
MDFDEFAKTTAFRQVAQTITALSTQDERIAEEFRLIETERVSKGKIVEIDGDVPVGMKMKLSDFAEAISTRVWESVGRANWRPFDEAVKSIHSSLIAVRNGWLIVGGRGRIFQTSQQTFRPIPIRLMARSFGSKGDGAHG